MALEHVRETVNFLCDGRRSITAIKADLDFGSSIDFSQIQHDEDFIWASYEQRYGNQEAYCKLRESECATAQTTRAPTC